MNKSYRVIWNYALQCYVVTSELARGKVKSSCSGKAANKSALIGGALGSALLRFTGGAGGQRCHHQRSGAAG